MHKWVIRKHVSTTEELQWQLPGSLTEAEIEEVLRRLVATNLSPDEVISASRPKGDDRRAGLFDRSGTSAPISFGNNPYYTAVKV
ncbi:Hypothetical protein NGAL_HAMBI2427_36240 [Neorhizobium galegae bv. orientalis]|nr:Hypothetical protein NGAL_HAMBI2427_36240 [Neorhizobium galegae bv. orientalis]